MVLWFWLPRVAMVQIKIRSHIAHGTLHVAAVLTALHGDLAMFGIVEFVDVAMMLDADGVPQFMHLDLFQKIAHVASFPLHDGVDLVHSDTNGIDSDRRATIGRALPDYAV